MMTRTTPKIIQVASIALIAAVATAVATTAFAQAPPLIPVQGALYDTEGVPIEGSMPVDFALYASESSLDALWSEGQRVFFDNGLFTVYLGQESELDLAMFADSGSFWLGIAVGGDEEMDRIEIATSPYAGFAQYCDDASTLGGLDPESLVADAVSAFGPRYSDEDARAAMGEIANGNALNHPRYSDDDARGAVSGLYAAASHGHPWGDLTGVPAGLGDGDDDSWAGMSCPDGQGLVRTAGAWICRTYGDITRVIASTGLSGGGVSGDVTLNVRFGGSGSANTASRSDHGHTSFAVRHDRDGVRVADLSWNPERYHMTTTNVSLRNSRRIPQTVLRDLCGDIDGCRVRLGATRWSTNSQLGAANREFVFYYGSNGYWRTSYDSEAIDGNGAVNHAVNAFDLCYFTDGEYVGGVPTGDVVGMNLLHWGTRSTLRCELTLID